MTEPTVRRDEANHRFEAYLGETLAGFLDYRQRGGEITLIHTETLQGFEGRGIGTALARFALDDTRSRGGKAVVVCPFVRAHLAKHPDYEDIVVRR